LALELFPRSMSSSRMHTATFSTGTSSTFFTKSKFVLMVSGKYSTNSLRSPSRCWTTSDAISTFTSSSAGVARFSNIGKFSAWAFRFQFSNFSTNALRVSMKLSIALALPCSFRLTLLSCWNTSARYAKQKINGYFRDWILFRLFLSLIIYVNFCLLLDACIWVYYHTIWI